MWDTLSRVSIHGEVHVAPLLALRPLGLREALGDLHPLLVEDQDAGEAGCRGEGVDEVNAAGQPRDAPVDRARVLADERADVAEADPKPTVQQPPVQRSHMLGAHGCGELFVLLGGGRADERLQRGHQGPSRLRLPGRRLPGGVQRDPDDAGEGDRLDARFTEATVLLVHDRQDKSVQRSQGQGQHPAAPLQQAGEGVAGHDEVARHVPHVSQLSGAQRRHVQVVLGQPPAGLLEARQWVPLPVDGEQSLDVRVQRAGPSGTTVEDHPGDAATRRLEPPEAVGAVLRVLLAEGGGDDRVREQGPAVLATRQPAEDDGHPLVLHGLDRQVEHCRPLDTDPSPAWDHLDRGRGARHRAGDAHG